MHEIIWSVCRSFLLTITNVYEYNHCSLLVANGDVLPGVTSAPQQQKFYTDDNWNLSGIWSGALIGWCSGYIVLSIVYEWQTKDKRPRKVKCKRYECTISSQYSWTIFFFRKSIWISLGPVHKRTQHWGADVPPGETSLVARSKEWRLYSRAI